LKYKTFKPKEYSSRKFIKTEEVPKHSGEINRDGFSQKKVPKDLDAIIIGSGIGGLSCAAFLSKVGKRCLVLEQHYIAGGCTHSFEDKGYEFDTGIHYIGNIKKRKKYLDLITEPEIEWDMMGDNEEEKQVYDEITIGSKKYKFRAGKENFILDLIKIFPDEEEAIRNYVTLCIKVSQKDMFFNSKIIQSTWLSKILNYFGSTEFFKYNNTTAYQTVSKLTKNKDLIAVLLSQFGDYGVSPTESSFFLHASIANHYFEGGWFPRGGSAEIAKSIIPVIEKTGGRVLVRKGVKQILIENGKACGVIMSNGLVVRAPLIISACGVNNTFNHLISEKEASKSGAITKIQKSIKNIGPSGTMLYLFVGLNDTPTNLKLRSSNIWHWPTETGDYDKMLNDFYKDPENAPIPMFIGFPCAKDSTWETRFPGKSNAVILTMINYEWFEQWEDEKQGKRGQDYEKFKEMFQKRLIDGLCEYYPQCREKIDYVNVGSPLTFNYYIGSKKGEVYGLDGKCDRFVLDDWLRPKTPIQDLYLTGCDIATLGFTGGLMSGILTAHSVLGYGTVEDILTGRNLIQDIMNINKSKKVEKVKVN